MDDDERKRKLEAGKAKLASFQKKRKSSGRTSKSRKHKAKENESLSASALSPRTDEALKSANAGDSTAVQTGSGHSDKGNTISDDSDFSTTAEEISTEEEASYSEGLSPRERIQELELTISDQQIALHKLTLENKELRDHEAELEKTVLGRDAVIEELRKNVSETASHVKQLQESLSNATESVKETDGDQSEIVAQLMQARQELKTYSEALNRQEDAMKQMAVKLQDKSLEAEEAHEICRSLKVELEKTMHTQTLSTEDLSALQRLRSELEEQHGQQIALMKKELDKARKEATELRDREEQRLLDSQDSSEMDASDVAALQEQVQQLSSQLEVAFRNADKDKREHDKEVVKLNQRLISTIDEYEVKLREEKDNVMELEGRLEMSDTVSSEIQATFSRQLQQLEDERDALKSQLRDAHGAVIENNASTKIIEDMEDQLTTYKAEIKETEKRLEERNKQNRKFQDELDKRTEELSKQDKRNKKLSQEISSLQVDINGLKEKIDEKQQELKESSKKHAEHVSKLKEEHKHKLEETIEEANLSCQEEINVAKEDFKAEMEHKLLQARDDHADELKSMHSQHHKQMEELKKDMDSKLHGIKEALEQEKKEQLGAVKDVHERSREREFTQLAQRHQEDIARIRQENEEVSRDLLEKHGKELSTLKERMNEEKIVDENRIRRELEGDFQSKMADLREELKRESELKLEHQQTDLQEKHSEEMLKLKEEYSTKSESQEGALTKELEALEEKLKSRAEEYEAEVEKLQKTHEENKIRYEEEHEAIVTQLKSEHQKRLEEREEEMRKLLQEQREEQGAAVQLIKDEAAAREETEKEISKQMESLQVRFKEATAKLEEEYSQKISALESEHLKEKAKLEEANQSLKHSLNEVSAERDGILNQAEESRKKLEALHHEEMMNLKGELQAHVQEQKEKMQRIQLEMESSRASRAQLQELKNELVARNAAVEQIESLRKEFSDKEQQLIAQHQEAVDKLKEDHDNEVIELKKRLEETTPEAREQGRSWDDMEKELEEYKEKLTAAQANLASLSAMSPMRPISSASDYDTANISAMNKDIRNALTITHISDVSGIGDEMEEGALHLTTEDEMIEEQLEEGDLPTLEEGDLIESKHSPSDSQGKREGDGDSSTSSSSTSSSTSNEYSLHEEDATQMDVKEAAAQEVEEGSVEIEVEVLKLRITELEKEIQATVQSHQLEMQNLTEKYETRLKETEKSSEELKEEALKDMAEQYNADKEDIIQKHEEHLKTIEDVKQNEMMQLRLKCASETASQIEEELNSLREQLGNTHKEEMESLKLALETEMNEKLADAEKKLQEKEEEKDAEIAKLSEEHSLSMEEKIAAIMAELYEQKQESLQKLSEQHGAEIKKISEDSKNSADEKEKQHQVEKAEFEKEIERLTVEVANLKCEYQNLTNGLEAGDNEVIKSLQQQHAGEIDRMKGGFALDLEAKLKEQAQEYEKAQSDYVNQHQERLDKFLAEREEDIRRVEEAKQKELNELDQKYQQELQELSSRLEEGKATNETELENQFAEEKKKLLGDHKEELKVVATKLVELQTERDELATAKERLQSQIEQLETEQEQAQSELKAALIAHHMEKFQAAITELDQHHLEEMEKLRQDNEQESEQYKKVAEDLKQKLKNLEEEYKASIVALKEDKQTSVAAMEQEYTEKLEEEKLDRGAALASMREAHEAQMQAIQEENDAQLKSIEEEISSQDRNHREALDNLLESQATKLHELQEQFEIALNATKVEGEEKAKSLVERVGSLETELKMTQDALNAIQDQGETLKETEEALVKEYQAQIEELSASLDEMGSKIEFERAEYESEIDQLQDDVRVKDENIKELEEELEKNTSALNLLKEKFDTVSSRREREGREEDNLIHMLRDDLDRLNDERDQLSNANQQLLATLTEIVQANHKCEDVINKRLQMQQSSRDSGLLRTDLESELGTDRGMEAASAESGRSSSVSPKLGASTGSYEDEGLDLSQRLAESMFAGPELDTSARDVAVNSGTRLQQAVQKLLEAVHVDQQQLNGEQQPRIILEDHSDQDDGVKRKFQDEEDDDTSSKSSEADDVKKMEEVLADYMNQTESLQTKAEMLDDENNRLKEENSLLQKQNQAFVDGGDDSHLELLKLTEDLSAEKQAISDQYEASRSHFEKQLHQLESSLEAETKKLEEIEREHALKVDDYQAQIEALQKQVTSNSKFSAEQTSERELEREQFQEEINQLQDELGKQHGLHRSDSKLSQELSRLEEEMEARDLAHQEQIAKMREDEERLKKTIQEYEENLQELREKDSDLSELEDARGQLQDMSREREVIQQELYDNLLKVSALEAKLDQYKHSGDMPTDNDPSQIERLKMSLDQEREDHEAKVEHLIEIHNQLRNEIIEKEEEIERLLQEMENFKEMEEENIRLKEDLKKTEAGAVPPPSSRAEELEALSRQLLDEKNAEIDELQSRLQDLENQKSSSSSGSSDNEEEKSSLKNLREENIRLKSHLQELEEKLFSVETPQQVSEEVPGQEEDLQAVDVSAVEQGFTAEHELDMLKEENEKLRTEIQELKVSVEPVPPILGMTMEMKEKIRHLEELLEKEKDSKQVEDGDESEQESGADTDINEKFDQLVEDLKSQPKSILGRILAAKDDKISKQDQKIKETESNLVEKEESVTKLQEKVSGLEHTLSEPDVKVRLRSKGKSDKGKKEDEREIDVEKELSSSDDSGSQNSLSSTSSSEDEEVQDDVLDGKAVNLQEDAKEKSKDELKILLDQKEQELQEKVETIENTEKALSEKLKECEQLQHEIAEMETKCECLQKELEQRSEEARQVQSEMPLSIGDITEEELINVPVVQQALANARSDLEKALEGTQKELAASKEERQKLVSELGDVQREYMALLGESQSLQEMQERQDVQQDKIKDLEDLIAERESELQQSQQENDQLQSNIRQVLEDNEVLKQGRVEGDMAKVEKLSEIQDTLERKINEYNRLLDELKLKEETIDELERQITNSKQVAKTHEDEIELLQNERQILNTENDRLQQETQGLKTTVDDLEHAIEDKRQEIEDKQKEIDVIKKERFIEPRSAMLLDEGSLDEEDLSMSSIKDEEPDSMSTEDLVKMHESKMEEMKNKYSQALTRVVEDTKKQLLEEHEKQIHEMQEKHRRDIAEILSESFSGESEVARRLREELDLADQLDQNLMGHLASAGGVSEQTSDADIPSKLKTLLDRVHNEGVQVLSLSELQFLKHYHRATRSPTTPTPSPPATVEEAQQTSLKLEEDLNQLKKAWENEKLTLINAIHALKELVAQTNPDTSMENLAECRNPRADLLNAVSDVFEKERDALIAELQTSVLEAQQEARNEPDDGVRRDALDNLLQVERRLQEQGSQHVSALERLMNSDRDALMLEIKDLRDDRRQNLKQAEERIRHLEAQLNTNEVTTSQNIHILRSQVERLEYKLQQERALAADVRSTLEAERVRSDDYLPALQRERDRSIELDNEIGRLQKKLAEEAEATRQRTQNLQAEVDEDHEQMDELQAKLAEACQKLIEAEQEAEHVKQDNARSSEEYENTIKELKRSLMSEEKRRDALAKSLEAERNNVAELHEELATLRADARAEIETQKIRLSEQEDLLKKEKRHAEDLNCALEREQETSERLRNTIDEERTLANEARQHDRATVADLQRILDDAKKETERVQKKMDNTERDKRLAKQQVEDIQAVHQDAIEIERAVRDQLQSALDAAQEQKQGLQDKVVTLEDELRRQNLSKYMTNAGLPPPSSTPEGLMAHRRQLESLRQRLQIESTKLQDLMSKTAQRLPFTASGVGLDGSQEEARALAAEMEQVDSVKRSLADMQQELKEMYSELSLSQRERAGVLSDGSGFNDRLMEQNAELVTLNSRQTDEKMALRESIRRLEEEVWKARAASDDDTKAADEQKQHQQQVQEMASRMHRLYLRYLRAESFRKALVYQKKYLLLLIGGFQDCEEATLALVARMGAYPGEDAYGIGSKRSPAFKKFRSAARVIIAVSRLKFLVRKASRTSHSISTSIKERHGATPVLNGHNQPGSSFKQSTRSVTPTLRPLSSTSAHGFNENSPSPTASPRHRRESYERPTSSYEPYRQTLKAASQLQDVPHSKHTPTSSYAASGARPRNAYTRSTTAPYLNSYGDQPSATALRYLNGNDRASTRPRPRSYHSEYRTPDMSSLNYSRAHPGESDPSLNEYIQKLENLQHRLEQNPHRYQR